MEAGSQGRPGRAGDEPSLTPNRPPLAWGTIIVMDLDRLGEIVESEGWSEYRPNEATGLLSNLVWDLAVKWRAIVVYGLDWDRGTEEAVLEIPGVEAREVAGDLVGIARALERVGVTVTIVAVSSPLLARPARNRREAYSGPRRSAKRILDRLKRKGGGVVYVDGEVVYVSGRPG